MKNIFKKIAVMALVMIMCVSSIVPSISAVETICPGEGYTHTADNCSYTVIAKTEATCLEDGIVTGQCNLCGKRFVADYVEALGHDWDVSAATCEASIVKTCKTCGVTHTTGEIPGHTWSEWTVTGGVCKIGERRSRTCSVCGEVESKIMTEAHNWVVDSYVAPEFCNEPAVANYVCENAGCDAKKTAKLWLNGENANHGTFVEWDPVAMEKADPNYVESTCSTVGYKSMVCSVCEYVKVVTTAKKDHYTPAYAEAHKDEGVVANLRFVDEVFQSGCGTKGVLAYWQCFDCGARFLAKETSQTKYYAANGTTYPAIKEADLPADAKGSISDKNNTHYPLYIDREYDMVTFGALVKKDSDLSTDCRYGLTHKRYDVYKPATCEADGYYSRNCTWCGHSATGIIPKVEHVFYSDVTTTEAQKAALKALKNAGAPGINDNTTWASIAPGKAAGKGITWVEGANATCEKNAYVLEICINVQTTQACFEGDVAKNTTHARCYTAGTTLNENNSKEYLLSGKGKEATGHEWRENKGADYAYNPAPTCTSAGVVTITCANGCGTKKTEMAPAKGHDFKNGTQTTIEAATCVKDGSASIKCKNCTETQTVVLAKSDKYHNFNYISAGDIYGHSAVVDAIEDLKCGQTLNVVFSCNVEGCPAKVNPATYTVKNDDHKYYDTTDAEKYEAIKAKKNKGDTIVENGVTAVECVVAGDCTKVASYRLNCLEGCGMFKSFEIAEGFNTGAHSIVLATTATKYANTCEEKKDGALVEYIIGGYYCSVETCPLYSEEGAVTASFKTYSSHLNAKGEAITYKDVPDAAISGAATLEEAMKVKAPVDENGNVTYAIDIPGTSLVWMYVADVSCSNDGVTLGGFYCVNCGKDQSKLTNTAKAQIYMTNDQYHSVEVQPTVSATCTTYGYTEKTCTKCFYTVQYVFNDVAEHGDFGFDVVESKPANCERDGYEIKQCKGCKVFVTEVLKATGHVNAGGDKLTGDCLNDFAINRTCKNCTKEIFWNHVYSADNKCTLCGEKKPESAK